MKRSTNFSEEKNAAEKTNPFPRDKDSCQHRHQNFSSWLHSADWPRARYVDENSQDFKIIIKVSTSRFSINFLFLTNLIILCHVYLHLSNTQVHIIF